MTRDTERDEHAELQADKLAKPTIGGSAASIIAMETAGLTPPYGNSMFELWAKLTGKVPESPDKDRFEMGRLMEEPVAIRFQRRTNLTVEKLPEVIHPGFPWYTGHIDRIVIDEPADLEIKTVGFYPNRDDEWSNPNEGEENRIPLNYLLQALWYAGIPYTFVHPPVKVPSYGPDVHDKITRPAFGRRIYIAAQFDFQPLRVYRYEITPELRELHKRMFEACQQFYEVHIQRDNPPPFGGDNVSSAKAALKYLYPRPTTGIVTTSHPEFVSLARSYEEARRQESFYKAKKDALGIELGKIIGSSYGVQGADGGVHAKATWPLIHAANVKFRRPEYRKLTVKLTEE